MIRLALFVCLAAVSGASAAASPLKAQIQKSITKHIQANVKENMGLYLVEDTDQINAWMADFDSFDWAAMRKLSDREYIVRAKFVEKPAAGEKSGARAILKIDYTMKPGKAGWRVAAEALQSVNGKAFFTYDGSGERIYADPSETLSVSIESDASEADDKKATSASGDDDEEAAAEESESSSEDDEEKPALYNSIQTPQAGPYDPTKQWAPGQKGYEGVGNAPDSSQGANNAGGVNQYQQKR